MANYAKTFFCMAYNRMKERTYIKGICGHKTLTQHARQTHTKSPMERAFIWK